MGKFIKQLDENYKFWQEMECPPESKLEYVGNTIFDFTTYDGAMDVEFAKMMLPVIKSIVGKTTFEYQSIGKDQYLNYLTMVNMPFLVDKIEWGTSIRGAWFDEFREYEIDCGRIVIKQQEINEFIQDLIEWCEGDFAF